MEGIPTRMITYRLFTNIDHKLAHKLSHDLEEELNMVDERLWPLINQSLYQNPTANFPYHGNIHIALFVRSIMLAFPHVLLTHEQKLNLIVAGAFHDWNHQLSTDDKINVDAARTAWADNSCHYKKIEEINPKLVSTLIKATTQGENPENTSESYVLKTIMRDSDILGWTFPEYRDILKAGLEKELGIEIFVTGLSKSFPPFNAYSLQAMIDAGVN